jgi:hypothetical protein
MVKSKPVPSRFVPRMLETLRAVEVVLAVGLIMFFFSETLFWGRPGRAPFEDLMLTWLAYCVLAWALLCALSAFNVCTLGGLILCGALYGWLSEGVLAGTLYLGIPFQISWTGLAWHDLLSVCAGWYGLNLALKHSPARGGIVAALWGAFWGAWATTWWKPQEGGMITPLPAFAAHAITQGVLLIIGLAASRLFFRKGDFASQTGRWFVVALIIAWFIFVTVPQQPLAPFVALPLFGLTTLTLWRHSTRPLDHSRQTMLELMLLNERLPWTRYLVLLLLPVCAVIVYALFLKTGTVLVFNQAVFWALTPVGFIVYGLSLWQSWKMRTEQ